MDDRPGLAAGRRAAAHADENAAVRRERDRLTAENLRLREQASEMATDLDAARVRIAEIDEILSVEEGQTWANPALTPHFVRRLRAALGDAI